MPSEPTSRSAAARSQSTVAPRERLQDAHLYLCVDARRHLDGDRPRFTALRELAEQVCEGGCDIIQLRDKNSVGEHELGKMTILEQLEALRVLAEVVHAHGALLAVNDRMDVAVAAGADVAHVGQDDIPTEVARQILGDDTVLGLSCHSPADVDSALANPFIDYFCTGPIWATPTKPGRPGVGLELVDYAARQQAKARQQAVKPWVAIGGVNTDNAPEVVAAGANRLVVVRALTDAPDPVAAARDLRACATGE
ncbi:thiamine phosphate synthase [Lawsonella clevelandensis]|uniref:thiamine phosphate synthase n=1 Tax=Lawsonella clevelandensis TaxID=1528099 RepID=UPI0029152C02|nr:thiamine phosphate synthase [Lawsonella clevelandensis]MDU7193463.1 thiamine phosphate synthase [Lawsonella clevelandensis]